MRVGVIWMAIQQVLLLSIKLVDGSSGGGKAFVMAVSSSDRQTALCAVSEANLTLPISDLPAEQIPAPVKCAKLCTSQAVCHSFNYRSHNQSCQFYHYAPDACHTIPGCKYFQVERQ